MVVNQVNSGRKYISNVNGRLNSAEISFEETIAAFRKNDDNFHEPEACESDCPVCCGEETEETEHTNDIEKFSCPCQDCSEKENCLRYQRAVNEKNGPAGMVYREQSEADGNAFRSAVMPRETALRSFYNAAVYDGGDIFLIEEAYKKRLKSAVLP